MPDHVHLVFRLGERLTLGKVIARLKSKTTSQLKALPLPLRWQPSYHDHKLRSDSELHPILHYLYLNPYRAKFIPPRLNLALHPHRTQRVNLAPTPSKPKLPLPRMAPSLTRQPCRSELSRRRQPPLARDPQPIPLSPNQNPLQDLSPPPKSPHSPRHEFDYVLKHSTNLKTWNRSEITMGGPPSTTLPVDASLPANFYCIATTPAEE